MITLRVGKQGIPLWFRCFEGKNDSDAFKTSLIKEGITYVSTLFNNQFDLIFEPYSQLFQELLLGKKFYHF